MTTDFWPHAWALETAIEATDPGANEAAAVVRDLADDYLLQRFLFVYRGWDDPSWFPVLRAVGVFGNPPGVERVNGGIRTQAWPALAYLKKVAPVHAGSVAEILRQLETENWWVITDGLDATEGLPDDLALPAIAHLLAEWQRTPVSWSDPRLLVRVLKRVVDASPAGAVSAASVARVLDRLWSNEADRYEIDEVLRGLGDLDPRTRFQVADGIELVLTSRTGQRRWMSQPFGPRLEDLNADRSDAAELLAAHWLDLTQDEGKEHGADATLARAIRLLAVSDSLVRQMGLRCLRTALDARPSDALARRMFTEMASDDGVLEREGEISELLALFRTHFGLLDAEVQASLVERLASLAASDDVTNRYYARDWLNAVRAYLGPRERRMLGALESELGPPREGFESPRAVASFVGATGPISSADAAAMAATDLLAVMRNVPRIQSDDLDSSVESIARLVKAEVERRPAEFLPILHEIADTVDYAAILHHIVWGLSEMYSKEEARNDQALDAVLPFVATVATRAGSGSLDEERQHGYGTQSVLRGVADFLEDLAPWLATAGHATDILNALDTVLSSDDPTPEHEARFGGSNMDPPTLALNTARGRGVRAMLRLLVVAAAADDAAPGLVGELGERARRHAREESSPSVLSGYGFYLPWLVTHTPDVWAEVKSHVLPHDNAMPRWEAVFTTYVTFNRLLPAVAGEIKDDYVMAIDRVTNASFEFLRSHADRLVQHLITLALPGRTDSDEWVRPLEAGLAAVPANEARAALSSLSHAVRREGLDVDVAWVLRLTARRLQALQREPRPEEATGFLELLLEATGAPPSQAGGLILNLMYSGAEVHTWSLVEYLIDHDVPRSGVGVRTLLAAMDVDGFGSFVRDEENFVTLLEDYATAAPELTWRLLNRLGSGGMFSVEYVAREVAAAVGDG